MTAEDTAKDTAEKAYKKKIEQLEVALKRKDSAIRKLLIEGAFSRSEFIKEKTVLIPEIAFDSFNKYFSVEEINGELKAFAIDSKGNKMLSLKNAGGYADPEEAIELLISSHPQKDHILRNDPIDTKISSNGNIAAIKNPFKKGETFNLTEQGKLARNNPALAKKLAKEAGIRLDLD